jgi:hypothetical protein
MEHIICRCDKCESERKQKEAMNNLLATLYVQTKYMEIVWEAFKNAGQKEEDPKRKEA